MSIGVVCKTCGWSRVAGELDWGNAVALHNATVPVAASHRIEFSRDVEGAPFTDEEREQVRRMGVSVSVATDAPEAMRLLRDRLGPRMDFEALLTKYIRHVANMTFPDINAPGFAARAKLDEIYRGGSFTDAEWAELQRLAKESQP